MGAFPNPHVLRPRITRERGKIGRLVNSNSRLWEPVPIFHVAFSSREMLVKRQLLFLLIA